MNYDVHSSSDDVSRLRRESMLYQLLSAHGIAASPPSTAMNKSPLWLYKESDRLYAVLVVEQQAIRLRPLIPQGDTAVALSPAILRRMKRMAVRAAYATGLDFAEVTLRQSRRDGQYTVELVDPRPVLDEMDVALYEQAVNEMQAEQQQYQAAKNGIMLGMDPEFILMNPEGKIVPANRFFSKRGRAGYDNVTVRGRSDVHPLVELRPVPSEHPAELIRNLRRAMWHAADVIDDVSLAWIAGGMPVPGLPLGGHIHLSGVPLNNAIVRALDNYLALPLLMLEHESGKIRRKKYGKLGDVRVKAYGGFEYRTLPSMLVSPRITKGAVALAKLIAVNYEQLNSRPLDRLDLLRAYYEGDKEKLIMTVKTIWLELTRLSDYGLYASYLDPLGEWIVRCRSWNEALDFRRAWRIPPFN